MEKRLKNQTNLYNDNYYIKNNAETIIKHKL